MIKRTISLFLATILTNNAYADENLADIEVISTNKTTQSIKDTTSNISVITADEIEERGYSSVGEALSSVAGISVSNSGGLGKVTSIFMRGMKTEKILVLLDGITLNNPSSTDGQAFFEHISMENIEQIEVIKGGMSSVWGSDASAGVINIITKKAKDGVHGDIKLGYGSYNSKTISSTLSYKKNNLEAILSLSQLKSDGFSALIPRDSEDDGYENNSLNLKLNYSFNENSQIRFNYNYIDANTQYDGKYSTLKQDDPLANIDTKQNDFSLSYLYNREGYRSNLKFTQTKSDRLDTSDSSYGKALSSYRATQQELSWINSYRYNSSNIFLGLEGKKIEGEYQFNSSAPTTNKFEDKAVFMGLTHSVNEDTLIEASIRKDFFEKFSDTLSYKIGLKRVSTLIDGLSTTLNYYKSTDAPNSYQVANTIAGVTLQPDTTKGYDISLKYSDFAITYFSNTIDNKLDYDTTKFGYINRTGEEKVDGFEIDFAHTFSTISVSTNYTHLLNYEDENNNRLLRRAKDTLNASIDYYTENDMHFGINAQYIGDREDLTQKSTGNYILVNLNFDTEIYKDTKLNINAKNIFDREYQSVYGYAQEGRAIYANIKYSF